MTEDERNLRILVGFIININCALLAQDLLIAVAGCATAMQWIYDKKIVGDMRPSLIGRLQEECVRAIAQMSNVDPEIYYPNEE